MPMREPDASLPTTRSILPLAFAAELTESDLRTLLQYLNGLTTHRFTGVYRFEPGWVVSVALWDRENPDVDIGANVKMKESYCWLTGLGSSSYVIEDALCDDRLSGHAAQASVRSYVAVLLRDRTGNPWGTLCHFDFQPRRVSSTALVELESVRPLVEEILVRDSGAHWAPDAPSTSQFVA